MIEVDAHHTKHLSTGICPREAISVLVIQQPPFMVTRPLLLGAGGVGESSGSLDQATDSTKPIRSVKHLLVGLQSFLGDS